MLQDDKYFKALFSQGLVFRLSSSFTWTHWISYSVHCYDKGLDKKRDKVGKVCLPSLLENPADSCGEDVVWWPEHEGSCFRYTLQSGSRRWWMSVPQTDSFTLFIQSSVGDPSSWNDASHIEEYLPYCQTYLECSHWHVSPGWVLIHVTWQGI